MDKKIIFLTTALGGSIGGYIPTLLGLTGLGWGVIGAFLGGLLGVYIGYQLSE